jgi:hypothetical protein
MGQATSLGVKSDTHGDRMIMKRIVPLIGAAVIGAATFAPVAAFAEPCDAYSGQCPEVEPTNLVRPTHEPPTEVAGEKTTLPFTGGEIVLLTLVGGGAVGAGTAFVIAGRRRRATTPA